MKQRSTLAIVSLILESTARRKRGVSKTRIMRDVVLTYKRASRYCNMMVEKGLLAYTPESRTYLLTPKGFEVLQSSKEIFGYLGDVKRMVERYKVYDENSINDIHHGDTNNVSYNTERITCE